MIEHTSRGRVEVVRLDRPPLNLLGGDLIDALRTTFEEISAGEPRVVVLECTGGGADVRELVQLDVDSARTFITRLHAACREIRRCPAPVIAAVDGPCLGAHLEVAAACDLRIASPSSIFGMPEVRVGIPSVIDACWLPLLCGLGEANRLVFDGGAIGAEEALRIGLINRIEDGAIEAAVAWASDLAKLSPVALRQQKRVVRIWTDEWYERAVAASIEQFAQTFKAPETLEAMRAFLEKRPPSFAEPRRGSDQAAE